MGDVISTIAAPQSYSKNVPFLQGFSMKTSSTAFLVAAFVVVSTVAAVAAPATTRRSAALYDGPSDRFDVITVIPRDTDVEVSGCSRGWCYVWYDDDEGFVRERLLDFYDESPPVVIFPPALYEYGWRYWRQHHRDDWGRWHERYRREYRPPPRRDDRPRRPQVAPPPPPPPAPRGAPSTAPRGAPSTAPRGAPSQAPRGAPSQAPRGGQSPGSGGGPASPDRDAPSPPPLPGGPPMPPR